MIIIIFWFLNIVPAQPLRSSISLHMPSIHARILFLISATISYCIGIEPKSIGSAPVSLNIFHKLNKHCVELKKSQAKGPVSIRPFSWLKPIFFKLCILKLICTDCLMVQYHIVWFTDFCCMHDLSGWGNSTPLEVQIQICYFFQFQVHASKWWLQQEKYTSGLKR